jgi:glucose/arabinose dehydrogenase
MKNHLRLLLTLLIKYKKGFILIAILICMRKGTAISLIIGLVAVFGIVAFLVFKQTIGDVSIPNTMPQPEPQTTVNGPIVSFLHVPDGFKATYFAKNVPGARVMIFDSNGRMLVSETDKGAVALLNDTDGDGTADTNTILIKGLDHPHGLLFDCFSNGNPCRLYVATIDALMRYDYDPAVGTVTSSGTNVMDFQNSATDRHKTRTLIWLPGAEGKTMLISIGSTCNVCNESTAHTQHGKILAFDVETNKVSEYATGLRNAVFMTTNFIDGSVWAADMGRDGLGDEMPPDEINIIKKGGNYGWPICYGKNIHDAEFDKNTYIRNPCMEPFEIPSLIDIPAHSAPLGLAFVPEEGWPEEYWYDLLVAYHGSWNRSEPTGYKIVRMKLDAKGNYSGTEDFITGWLTDTGKKLGRPADILVQPGGVMYVSDDLAGVIYKIAKTSE